MITATETIHLRRMDILMVQTCTNVVADRIRVALTSAEIQLSKVTVIAVAWGTFPGGRLARPVVTRAAENKNGTGSSA
jgi:hypothetical protein